MLKIGLLCGVISAMSVCGVSSLGLGKAKAKEIDSKFIVELNDDIENISQEKAEKEQKQVFSRIKNYVNANAEKIISYSVLTNSFVVSGNKTDLDLIKNISGVKSVSEINDKVVKKTESSGFSIPLHKDSGIIDINKNASAQTMEKPEDTNDGEGTLIAVLDNEFYFRGKSEEGDAWHHEVYEPMSDDVKVKVTFDWVKQVALVSSSIHAKYVSGKKAGEEGSLYYNNKVPFYYDYAGDSDNGNRNGVETDKDGWVVGNHNVVSKYSLHGSHVSSIAAANAPEYKGIAPKAQLACMKVFTDVTQTDAGMEIEGGNYSTFSEIGFIAALEDAMLIGADAINVSIGSDLDDFDLTSVTMKTLEKISDKGILTAISAGNGGKSAYAFTGGYGNWTRDMVETGILGSFANNAKTMSIASGQPDYIFYENALRLGEENVAFEDQIVNREGQPKDYDTEFKLSDLVPDEHGEFEYLYIPGFGASGDYKGLNVEGKIAVVNRGSIDFATKYANARDRGAKALIIINNDPTANDFNFRCSFGDGFKPTMPCALVLFKDKILFQNQQSGKFSIIHKQVSENKQARTISDFSSDGARFDLDLKPDITTPGTNIRGAVYPQKKEQKEETPLSSYEYFNGTSMAAPNYLGALSVLVSKQSKDALADGSISTQEEKALVKFRKTVDMRYMSTANIMSDFEANGENGEKSPTSPRLQGAGMADIDGAYHTEVYLKGKDADGTVLEKSKILLRNREDIANGNINLSFKAINEGSSAHTYDAELVVMRPATTLSNKVVSKDYNLTGEVSELSLIPGLTYAVLRGGEYEIVTNDSTAKFKDVINVSKDIEYYVTKEDAQSKTNVQKFSMGYYYWSENNKWEPLPSDLYQSVKDVVIARVSGQSITVEPGENDITINPYSLSEAEKNKIAEYYPYGTYIEGYVLLKATEENVPDLNIPYLGFYSLTDKDSSMSYDSAPVVEPFSFEKDKKQIYQSDLVNDLTKSLLGKSFVNFESMWMAGYAESASSIDTNKVLKNEDNFSRLSGFYPVGTAPTPYSYEETSTPAQDIYVGNKHASNTMIIQQFVMRSVKDNYFTIKNKATGEVVYKDALQDMLFGEQAYKYPLYKSHVDSDYLGAGYVAHRAYAIVPLYDPLSKKAFDSGDYEVTFNYQLAATDHWVSKSYTLHLDQEAPVVKSICETDGKVRIDFSDVRVAYAVIGTTKYDVSFDSEKGVYYVEVDKSVIDQAMLEAGKTSLSNKRLYVAAIDYARGRTGALVHFTNDNDYANYVMLQGYGLTIANDFSYQNGNLSLISRDSRGNESPDALVDGGQISTSYREHGGSSGSSSSDIAPAAEGDNAELGFFAKIAQALKEFWQSIVDGFKNLFGGK